MPSIPTLYTKHLHSIVVVHPSSPATSSVSIVAFAGEEEGARFNREYEARTSLGISSISGTGTNGTSDGVMDYSPLAEVARRRQQPQHQNLTVPSSQHIRRSSRSHPHLMMPVLSLASASENISPRPLSTSSLIPVSSSSQSRITSYTPKGTPPASTLLLPTRQTSIVGAQISGGPSRGSDRYRGANKRPILNSQTESEGGDGAGIVRPAARHTLDVDPEKNGRRAHDYEQYKGRAGPAERALMRSLGDRMVWTRHEDSMQGLRLQSRLRSDPRFLLPTHAGPVLGNPHQEAVSSASQAIPSVHAGPTSSHNRRSPSLARQHSDLILRDSDSLFQLPHQFESYRSGHERSLSSPLRTFASRTQNRRISEDDLPEQKIQLRPASRLPSFPSAPQLTLNRQKKSDTPEGSPSRVRFTLLERTRGISSNENHLVQPNQNHLPEARQILQGATSQTLPEDKNNPRNTKSGSRPNPLFQPDVDVFRVDKSAEEGQKGLLSLEAIRRMFDQMRDETREALLAVHADVIKVGHECKVCAPYLFRFALHPRPQ